LIKYQFYLNPSLVVPSINLLLSNKSYSTSINPNVDNSNFNLALQAFATGFVVAESNKSRGLKKPKISQIKLL
jgi:hypothetical protein